MKKIVVGFLLTNWVVFFCSAQVLREDIVLYSLDYHELRVREDAIEQAKDQEVELIQTEKKQKNRETWEKRKSKIDAFLRDVVLTLKYQATYNDNIYKEKDAQGDLAHVASINANYISRKPHQKRGKTDFFLDFSGDGIGYSTAKTDASKSNLRAGLNYDFTEKYGVLLETGYTKQKLLASDTHSSNISSRKMVDNNINSFAGTFNARWGRFPLSAKYERRESKFEEGYEISDNNQNVFKVSPAFTISPKTDIFCEYTYGESEYPERSSSDYTYSTYMIGGRGKITSKISGIVKFGWGEYDHDSGVSRKTEETEVSLNYNLSKRFFLRGMAGSRTSASTYADTDSSESTYIGLSGRYFPPFNKKLTIKGSARSTVTELSDNDREDELFSLKLGAEYGFNKYLTMSIEYQRSTLESSFPDRGYEQNITSLAGIWEF